MTKYTGEEILVLRQLNIYGSLIKKYIDDKGILTETEIKEEEWSDVPDSSTEYLGIPTYKIELLTEKVNSKVEKIVNASDEEMFCICTVLGRYITLYSDEKFSGKMYTS